MLAVADAKHWPNGTASVPRKPVAGGAESAGDRAFRGKRANDAPDGRRCRGRSVAGRGYRPIAGTLVVAVAIAVKPIALVALPFVGLIWAGVTPGGGSGWRLGRDRRQSRRSSVGLGVVSGTGLGWIAAPSTPVRSGPGCPRRPRWVRSSAEGYAASVWDPRGSVGGGSRDRHRHRGGG